jgi:hypothetical protein
MTARKTTRPAGSKRHLPRRRLKAPALQLLLLAVSAAVVFHYLLLAVASTVQMPAVP